MARTTDNIKKHHPRVLCRATAAFTEPASASAFTTFLATFAELGYSRNNSIKHEITPAEPEPLDDGNDHYSAFDLHLEFLLLQSEIADHTIYEAHEGIASDILFYDEVTDRCVIFFNVKPFFKVQGEGGATETVLGTADKKNVATKAAILDRFQESQA